MIEAGASFSSSPPDLRARPLQGRKAPRIAALASSVAALAPRLGSADRFAPMMSVVWVLGSYAMKLEKPGSCPSWPYIGPNCAIPRP